MEDGKEDAPEVEQRASELLTLGAEDAGGDSAEPVEDLEERDDGKDIRDGAHDACQTPAVNSA